MLYVYGPDWPNVNQFFTHRQRQNITQFKFCFRFFFVVVQKPHPTEC